MDINSIQPTEHTFDLLHPATDEPIGVSITLRSMESEEVRVLKRSFTNEALRLNRKGKTPTSADLERNTKRLLAAAVAGWKWTSEDIDLNGEKKPAFNVKNLNALLEISWVASQIDEQLGDEKNFFKH